MDTRTNTSSFAAANYFIEGVNEIGVEYLFSNMGTDHAPIIEALAGRAGRSGAALHEMGMDASVRRGREGGAPSRPHRDAERAEGAGLPDAAARDPDRFLGYRGHALLPGGALRQRGAERRRSAAGR